MAARPALGHRAKVAVGGRQLASARGFARSRTRLPIASRTRFRVNGSIDQAQRVTIAGEASARRLHLRCAIDMAESDGSPAG